jgi:SAM-dependent methyltransferase
MAGVNQGMRGFWDDRGREDPFFFVDNRLDYGKPDLERFWAGGQHDLDKLLDAVGAQFRPGDTAVEIGCGVGRLTRHVAPLVSAVKALDISGDMLRLAREHNPELGNVEWIHGDGASLAGIDDASADCIVSHVVFQHIPDPRTTLAYITDMGRVLRPGGWAAFQFSNDPKVHQRPGFAGRAAAWLRARAGRGPRGQAHIAWLGSAVEVEDLRVTAEAAGLRLERLVGEGTQYCVALLRHQDRPSSSP